MATINPLYQILVPTGMTSIGVYLQSRDQNRTGSDDAYGQLLVALSPAITSALEDTQSLTAERRIMTSVRDVAQARLDALASQEAAKGGA